MRTIKVTHIPSLVTCKYLVADEARTPEELLTFWLTQDRYYHINSELRALMLTQDSIEFRDDDWEFNFPIKGSERQFMAELVNEKV